uniref:Uncharacterized protein n=1 Tax=Zea mays TaxID=4577 RepID=B8A3T3_MAIZE|nr:unknown [Zea mays]
MNRQLDDPTVATSTATMSVWPPWYRNLMDRLLGGRLFSSTRINRLRSFAYSQGTLLYSTSTTRRSLRRAALPALAMAAYAAALSTSAVRFDVRAWSVTTTLAPAALHSSLSLHRTCKQCQPLLTHNPNRANHGNRETAAGHALRPKGREREEASYLPGSRRRSRRRPCTARGWLRRAGRR